MVYKEKKKKERKKSPNGIFWIGYFVGVVRNFMWNGFYAEFMKNLIPFLFYTCRFPAYV
jgi:hypothetical protein